MIGQHYQLVLDTRCNRLTLRPVDEPLPAGCFKVTRLHDPKPVVKPTVTVRSWFRTMRAADFALDLLQVLLTGASPDPADTTADTFGAFRRKPWTLFDTQALVERVTAPTYASLSKYEFAEWLQRRQPEVIEQARWENGKLFFVNPSGKVVGIIDGVDYWPDPSSGLRRGPIVQSTSNPGGPPTAFQRAYTPVGLDKLERSTEPMFKARVEGTSRPLRLSDIHGFLSGDDE